MGRLCAVALCIVTACRSSDSARTVPRDTESAQLPAHTDLPSDALRPVGQPWTVVLNGERSDLKWTVYTTPGEGGSQCLAVQLYVDGNAIGSDLSDNPAAYDGHAASCIQRQAGQPLLWTLYAGVPETARGVLVGPSVPGAKAVSFVTRDGNEVQGEIAGGVAAIQVDDIDQSGEYVLVSDSATFRCATNQQVRQMAIECATG